MKTIGCISLGCDKNTTDSEAMLGFLQQQGYTLVHPEEADVLLVNTCAFIKDAIEEAEEEIRWAIEQKIKQLARFVIVAGCLVERKKETLFLQFPLIDAIIDTKSIHRIDAVIADLEKNESAEAVVNEKNISPINLEMAGVETNKNIDNSLNAQRIQHMDTTVEKMEKEDKVEKKEKISFLSETDTLPPSFFQHRVLSTLPHMAYLKIAEGCSNHCTYCIIPSLRGKYRSHPMEDILAEAKILESLGVKELILVAQDTACYGVDLYGSSTLHTLVTALSKLDFEWIRVLYTYPEHVTDEFLIEMRDNPKVCKYLDMPIQHGSDKILKKMNRKMTQDTIMDFVTKVRNLIPSIHLRTSIIVGFPGETKEDFNTLLFLLGKIKFEKLGVFPYAREEGTPAYTMKNQIEEALKNNRYNEVMRLQQEISNTLLDSYINDTLYVLVDAYDVENEAYIGRSQFETPDVDGVIYIVTDRVLSIGSFVPVTLVDHTDYDLIGVLHEFTE